MTDPTRPPRTDAVAWSGWFAGPKAENGEWFSLSIHRILQDYHSWRRNYFPEDGSVVDRSLRLGAEAFQDEFQDRLMELLGRLKSDFPFHSPRYAAHMLSEQTLPSIAGYFAAMLYNPNNVSTDAAPVTVRLELEAAQLIARMLGYDASSWAHLTSGGTIANIEALWIARSVKYLPFALAEWFDASRLPRAACLTDSSRLLSLAPRDILGALATALEFAPARQECLEHLRTSRFNIAVHGVASIERCTGSRGVILAPETHHYSLSKAADLLGIGRNALHAIPVDHDLRMRVDALDAHIDALEQSGQHVIAVVAIAGTTEEGVVDPIDEIAALRTSRESRGASSFWLHADAAYGGYLRSITIPDRTGLGDSTTCVQIEHRVEQIALELPIRSVCGALEKISEADSIVVDPHKLGYIPYPAGAVCFKHASVKLLARQDAPYLDAPCENGSQTDLLDSIGVSILEGSKPGAAAAAVWLSHTLIPLDNAGHGRLLKETIRNACELHALLKIIPARKSACVVRAAFPCATSSNIVCFAFRPLEHGASLASINALNRAVHAQFTLRPGERVYNQSFFVSRTEFKAHRYAPDSVRAFLESLGVSDEEYRREGVFVLRSVLMNPWYEAAKRKGRYYISELASELTAVADDLWIAQPWRASTP